MPELCVELGDCNIVLEDDKWRKRREIGAAELSSPQWSRGAASEQQFDLGFDPDAGFGCGPNGVSPRNVGSDREWGTRRERSPLRSIVEYFQTS